MVKLTASHPDYPAIALALHLLGVLINPACWFGVEMPALEQIVWRSDTEGELFDLLEDARRGD